MTRRRTLMIVAVLLAAVAAAWQAPGRVTGFTSPAPTGVSSSEASGVLGGVTRDDSIVVFAAHPDDESLGAGGLIHAAVRAGARVRVAVFTNGDGYLEGVDVDFHTLLSTPDRFIEYGRRRQQEAIAAARRLGLRPDQVTFLGYPDRGLAVLWGQAWECTRLYTSPYTRRNHSPYAGTYRPGIAYCGRNVIEDVDSLLRRERPTIVVSHHPADTHRDHWAAGQFVTAALEQLWTEDLPWMRSVRVWSYLVHRGAWPVPAAYAPDLSLTPPADLLAGGGGWREYRLDPSDEDAERQALLEYKTQVRLLRTYVLSFVRRNDLFDVWTAVRPEAVDGSALPITAPERWDRLPPVVRGGPHDLLVRATGGSASLDSVGLAQDSARLYVAVRLRGAAIREAQYRLVMELLYRDGHSSRLRLLFRVPGSLEALRSQARDLPLPPGALARSFGRRIDIALPLAAIGFPAGFLMHFETTGPLRTPVERSPWALVRLNATVISGGRDTSPPPPSTVGIPARPAASMGAASGMVE